MGCNPINLRAGSFGRPMGFGRPTCRMSDVRNVSDVRLFDKSLYFRCHLEQPFVGRPSGFGRPSCRTSELERTSVVSVSLCNGSTSSSPSMSDVRNVSDGRSPSVHLLLLEPDLLLLDLCLCLGCPHHLPPLQKASTSTLHGRRSTLAATNNTWCAEEHHQCQTLVQVMVRYELQLSDETQ